MVLRGSTIYASNNVQWYTYQKSTAAWISGPLGIGAGSVYWCVYHTGLLRFICSGFTGGNGWVGTFNPLSLSSGQSLGALNALGSNAAYSSVALDNTTNAFYYCGVGIARFNPSGVMQWLVGTSGNLPALGISVVMRGALYAIAQDNLRMISYGNITAIRVTTTITTLSTSQTLTRTTSSSFLLGSSLISSQIDDIVSVGTSTNGSNSTAMLVGIIVGAFLLACVIVVIIIVRRRKSPEIGKHNVQPVLPKSPVPKHSSYSERQETTVSVVSCYFVETTCRCNWNHACRWTRPLRHQTIKYLVGQRQK
jgi:hypothetical protein